MYYRLRERAGNLDFITVSISLKRFNEIINNLKIVKIEKAKKEKPPIVKKRKFFEKIFKKGKNIKNKGNRQKYSK